MGKKSEKKVKADRINILRQQYDSFLEKDKIRKERNEYILQHLEKMRHATSSAAQLRPKVFAEYSLPSYNRFDYRPENVRMHDVIPIPHPNVHQQIIQPNLQLDIPRQFDDISILREISKKYILIPKSRTFIPNNYIVEAMPPSHDNKPVFSENKSNTVDNGDWRSKYDILEQLKNKEKEENNNLPNKTDAMDTEQSYKNDNNNIKKFEMQNDKYEDLPSKYETELPEKDLPSNNFLVENEIAAIDNLKISDNSTHPKTNIVQFQKPPESNSINHELASQIPNTESNTMENNVPITEKVQHISQQKQNTVHDEHKTQENTAYSEGNEQLSEYQNYPNEYEHQDPMAVPHQEISPHSQENDIHVNENEYSPVQTINPSELIQEIHNEPELRDDKDTAEIEYPIDVIDVAEFTPKDNVQLQDGININPEYAPIQDTYDKTNVGEYVPNQETYEQSNVDGYATKEIDDQQNIAPTTAEHVDDKSGIEAFDAEQKEMFYSEQQGEYAYDQQAAGDRYDPEYVTNEQYQGNPDYSYYGELDQQEAYPVEINEHDETNQRYDPNYEQQYAPTQQQDYVDPQQYEQNQQQYEQNQQQYEQNQQQYEQNQQQYEQNQQQYEQNQQQYEQNQPQVPEHEQQYEQPALYEQMQQGYEQYAYEQQNADTTQDVEQVLDKEEGYVAEEKIPAVEKKIVK